MLGFGRIFDLKSDKPSRDREGAEQFSLRTNCSAPSRLRLGYMDLNQNIVYH